jgi:Tfp pilus assembly protein PilF
VSRKFNYGTYYSVASHQHVDIQFRCDPQLNFHDTRAHFRYALKLNPENVEVHCEYARLLSRFGHRHEAEAQYKKALELDPGHFGTLCGYGDLLKEKGLYAKAEEIYRQADFFKRSA